MALAVRGYQVSISPLLPASCRLDQEGRDELVLAHRVAFGAREELSDTHAPRAATRPTYRPTYARADV